ncbi:MAG: nuclear transport factor 2 family protein [Tannerella sp.]|jgi:hypothetical protein|nr:nuclear transport factor 2 family protein [Tannerella sp.]
MRKIVYLLLTIAMCNVTGKTVAQSEKVWFSVKDGMEDLNVMSKVENNTTSFLNACNDAILTKKKPNFPSGAIAKASVKTINSFWETTPMYCSKTYISEKCLKRPSGGYQVRNIAVHIPDAPEGQQDQEIVINFTPTGEIDNISISVEETRYREIMEDYITLDDFNRRQVIVDFVENFRTSYNIKDIKYIESVFSDQALIITGKVVKIAPGKDQAINSLLGTEKITYQTFTKKEYIQSLKNTFTRNKYIDIQFEDLDVVRHPKNDFLYGVTLRQKWGSSTYNDTGYLFLMIDFKNEMQPMIHVRTWQPDSYNGRELSKDELFKLNDFNIQNL